MDTTLSDRLIGQVLDDRYRIDALIAVGGMATVYRAVDTRLDRVLALKVMHPALAADASFVERFIREAKSVARLAHPNVVGVYDQGTDGGYVFLAMEYVAGCTLRDVLRERGALRPRAALDILEPVLAALGAAHRAGFVHRDMKPENVLIGDDGRVKVADFGLVRAVNTITSTTGTVLGTVSYLAPEQIEHGTADPRVDVYACGVVLYEMLTGARPHSGDSAAQVLYQHLSTDVPAPSASVPGMPAELDALVASAAARAPQARPQDAVALLADARRARQALTSEQLDALPPGARATAHDNAEDRTSVIPSALRAAVGARSGRRRHAGGSAREDVVAMHHSTSRLESPPPVRRRPRPRRGTLALIIAVLAVLGLGVGVWYINSGQFTRVPPLLAKTESEASRRLADADLKTGDIKHAYSDTDERGTVIASDPKAGSRIRSHDEVGLTISLGPRTVRVPDLQDVPLSKARAQLKGAGLAPGMVNRTFSDAVEKGAVIRTDPPAGNNLRAGSAVALTVSRGEPVDVPDVGGESAAEATADLHDAGFGVKVADKQVSSPFDAGTVAAQSPGKDTQAGEGDVVTLTLSKGPEMIEVPDVVGQNVDDAKQKLTDAGFDVDVDRGFLDFGDKVKDQSVQGGDKAPEGGTITLKVG
ncbi:Stk1 family PASTA domain-containing Ser/Thr kinase [Streptomyces sp. TS71-3]|uniref:Stk1 family PASTA domain-containing Ser/Thr kinase n=1 Tax=Streptomyces sp. TS71-3 TaxID=2733862 RepID=UPI001B1154BA|nr:Stk1 family PASTA domain-containing Ser/Thr kinase [Streptomyces sp. TS71-3]GHJ38195.1 serine/threonine protein kinase [Streptomyces sp. TS71-3]